MFRVVACVVAFAFPVAIAHPANAQSSLMTGSEAELALPAPSAPISITQRYAVPRTRGRELHLLIDPPSPAAGTLPSSDAVIATVSPRPSARPATRRVGDGQGLIVVSSLKRMNE